MYKTVSNLDVYDDCFAINDYLNDCKCLKKLYCKKEECSFYKPKTEVNWQDIEKAINNYNIRKLSSR